MKKSFILIFTVVSLNINGIFAQESPVKVLNNTCTMNVDTIFVLDEKSKLTECDNPLQIVNDSVSKFFIDDNKNDTITRNLPNNIIFTYYHSVKNITDKPIWCTKELAGWYDTQISEKFVNWSDKHNFVIIQPNTTYKMPIQMRMASRYCFNKGGQFIVFSEDVYEIHKITIKSDFKPKGKYK